VLQIALMAALSSGEIGQRLHSTGALDRFEQAIEADDAMEVMTILESVEVEPEIISRMLLQLDKDYLLELASTGRDAAAG
jgi:hypothetical protein